jgi:drug/metabolite transporter (DMT)-like permease
MRMSHRHAVWVMVAATLMWSIAGVVSRHLEAARSFEVTFWRSAFNALALVLMLSWLRGPAVLWQTLRRGGRALWLSGVCWAVMFTAFMLALTLTTVANVLVTMSIGPLLTALAARLALGHRLATRTWAAIAVAGAGIAWMYGREVSAGDPKHLLGTAVALAVPIAASLNWTLLQHLKGRDGAPDMLGAVLIGALLCAACTLPLALPFAASPRDLSLLARDFLARAAGSGVRRAMGLGRCGRVSFAARSGRRRAGAGRAGGQRSLGHASTQASRCWLG